MALWARAAMRRPRGGAARAWAAPHCAHWHSALHSRAVCWAGLRHDRGAAAGLGPAAEAVRVQQRVRVALLLRLRARQHPAGLCSRNHQQPVSLVSQPQPLRKTHVSNGLQACLAKT
eukprot:COSAG01_NODE_14354_length_1464_cov_0.891654_1_plen_116_part_10